MPNVFQIVTDRIIDQLNKGVIPWRKPWTADYTAPANLVSRKAYRGINVFLLAAQGRTSPWWGTFNQFKQLGGCVQKGEKGTMVVFWKIPAKVETEDEPETETKRWQKAPLLRYYTVFNAEQVNGLDPAKIPAAAPKPAAPIAEAESIVQGMPRAPMIQHVPGDLACYAPALDLVTMPMRTQFPIAARYYSTLFHELTHATAHPSRLNRELGQAFGDQIYAREELIAEMGAAFLAAEAGIVDVTIEESASYIQTWITRLQNDKQLIVFAAGRAQKAVDFIRNRSAAEVPAAPAAVMAKAA
jgi:antirestriction protein ArdC